MKQNELTPHVSCIIPAFNEARRIANVLRVVTTASNISEIIVVDDGSTDATADIARTFQNVRVLIQSKNQGKAAAVIRGIKEATNDLIILLDADLHELTQTNVDMLATCIQKHADMMIIGGARDPLGLTRIKQFDLFSGERAFHKKTFPHLPEQGKIRYGLEAYLDLYAIRHHVPIAVVPMPKVRYMAKTEKAGLIHGLRDELRMTAQITHAVGIFSFFQLLGWYILSRPLIMNDER